LIDKIQVITSEFDVKKGANLEVQPGVLELSTGEIKGDFYLFDMNGEQIHGKKAFYNHELFNVDIDYFRDKSSLKVSYSPTKVFHQKDNFLPITKDQTKEANKYIQSELNEIGIGCNLENAEMTRIDLFNNANLDHKFRHYEHLFSVLNCKRKLDKTDFGGTGYLYKNTQQETAIYDKVIEQQQKLAKTVRNEYKIKHGIPPKVDYVKKEVQRRLSKYPPNVGRFEQRLIKKPKIESVFGFTQLKETINNYDMLVNYYKSSMNEGLFKHSFDEVKILTAESLTGGIEYYYNRYKRGWFEKYLAENGLKSLLNVCDVDTILEAVAIVMSSNGNTDNNIRVKLHRLEKNIDTMRVKIKMSDESIQDSGITNVKLYQEIKSKILKVA